MSSLHSLSTANSDAQRLQMERSIDELAELARNALEPARFFGEVLRRSLQPGGATYATLWRPSLDGLWESAGELPQSGALADQLAEGRQELLEEVARGSQPKVTSGSADSLHADRLSVLSPLRHANITVGILETVFPTPTSAVLSPTVYQYLAALSEITADFLSQQELQQLRRIKGIWQQWDHYQQRLQQSLDLQSICAAIVNDGRILVDCDRATILVLKQNQYRVHAISGVERVDSRAGAVRSLESVANCIRQSSDKIWTVLPPDPTMDVDRKTLLERYQQETNACCLGVLCINDSPDQTATGRPPAMLVLEKFTADANWGETRNRAESLVQRSAFALRAALTLNEIPGLLAWKRWRNGKSFFRRPALLISLAALTFAAIALIAIPSQFIVTGHGELWPSLRRDVFASTAGIVDQVLVKHGDDVAAGQPLLVLRDPELEQDTPRVIGELATTRERLRGVQLARLTSNASSDNASKIRQLAADEEELKERLKTLERQRTLIEERQQQLTLRSPIAGRVLSWNLAQHLSARPVERGQSLLTIGETSGSWIVEVQVADEDTGHLLRAQQALGDHLEVDFQLPSEPGRNYHGKVREVSLTSESNDRSTGHVRAVVEFDSQQVTQLRPGATAIPRIHCGRKSLGYVWLHDLIDAIRIRLRF
jgi:multidrug efflux pump subunit AcrA (membrane-fusion protein)